MRQDLDDDICNFQPQSWRPNRCKKCFRTELEHGKQNKSAASNQSTGEEAGEATGGRKSSPSADSTHTEEKPDSIASEPKKEKTRKAGDAKKRKVKRVKKDTKRSPSPPPRPISEAPLKEDSEDEATEERSASSESKWEQPQSGMETAGTEARVPGAGSHPQSALTGDSSPKKPVRKKYHRAGQQEGANIATVSLKGTESKVCRTQLEPLRDTTMSDEERNGSSANAPFSTDR